MDAELHCKLLPAQVLIKNSVKGDKECNYELYMIEFINSSLWFREKVGFKKFHRPESESHGECDCYAGNYGLDFKLTASQTRLQACSELSNQTVIVDNSGEHKTIPPKRNTSYHCTVLHKALQSYDLDGLCELRKKRYSQGTKKADIRTFLEKLEFKKNLLLYYPHKFYYRRDIEFNKAVKNIVKGLNYSFKSAMQYRMKICPEYETYMGFIYNDFFVIMCYTNNKFKVIDYINTQKSPIFTRLYNYVFF